MRRFLVAIAVVVFVLTLVFASVAGAQSTPADNTGARPVCQIIINIMNNDQYALQNGVDNTSAATIAQYLNIPVNIVQQCTQQMGSPGNNPSNGGTTQTPGGTQTTGNTQGGNTVINVPGKPLPNTGGPLLPVAGGALLLVGAGLAVRMFRR